MDSTPVHRRSRGCTLVVMVAIVLLGLGSRRFSLFPTLLGKYPGDALWTALVFAGWALVFPAGTTLRLALLALLTSFAVEFSQLLQTPWVVEVRRTSLGHLVLGSTYSPPDLVAYAVGALVAGWVDARVCRLRPGRPPFTGEESPAEPTASAPDDAGPGPRR
jgi:hypothetical protein